MTKKLKKAKINGISSDKSQSRKGTTLTMSDKERLKMFRQQAHFEATKNLGPI